MKHRDGARWGTPTLDGAALKAHRKYAPTPSATGKLRFERSWNSTLRGRHGRYGMSSRNPGPSNIKFQLSRLSLES